MELGFRIIIEEDIGRAVDSYTISIVFNDDKIFSWKCSSDEIMRAWGLFSMFLKELDTKYDLVKVIQIEDEQK